MEYSKEDLMEAKKQIWGVGENMGTEESKKIWEENAQFWDNAMGDESNEFHREVVRPKVTELLSPNPADYIYRRQPVSGCCRVGFAFGAQFYSPRWQWRDEQLYGSPDGAYELCIDGVPRDAFDDSAVHC